MIKKIILYSIVFILSLLISLIALLPANVLWAKVLEPQLNLRQQGVDVQKVMGSIWDGQALVAYQRIYGIISWNLKLDELLKLNLPVSLRLDSQVGTIEGNVELFPSGVTALIKNGQIDLAPLNSLFRAQRVTLDGQLLIKNLKLEYTNNQISYASGIASWSGGDIAYPAGREVHQRRLPMFKATAETKPAGDIYVSVRDSQASFDVISAEVDQSGTALVKITRRLLDLSDEPWSVNSTEQDVVFKVKKALY